MSVIEVTNENMPKIAPLFAGWQETIIWSCLPGKYSLKMIDAKLILECLEREKYPSWDAINLRSVALAEKLGYHRDKEYDTYEMRVR